jgi:hypothetical protein
MFNNWYPWPARDMHVRCSEVMSPATTGGAVRLQDVRGSMFAADTLVEWKGEQSLLTHQGEALES